MSGPEPDRGAIAFAEKLLTVLDQGRFVATYKLAVLLGLMDLCLEHSTRSGAAPTAVRTPDLAEKVVELYWPHTRAFGDERPRVLRQNSGGQAEIVAAIGRFRARHAPDPSATLARARTHAPRAFERLVRAVEWKLVAMPLPRLQVVGNVHEPFLYRIGWNERVRRSEFSSEQFDPTIRFVGEASEHLVRLAGLLRPFVQREWVRLVGHWNADLVRDAGLEEFLFGVPRAALAEVRDDLRRVDEGRCFYCGRRLGDRWHVDHFVPWARHPDNGLENLVSADEDCNVRKSDHLAAVEHVERWLERGAKRRDDLASIAALREWDHHPDRSVGVARSIYLRLPADARLWRLRHEFVAPDRRRLVEAFAGARP